MSGQILRCGVGRVLSDLSTWAAILAQCVIVKCGLILGLPRRFIKNSRAVVFGGYRSCQLWPLCYSPDMKTQSRRLAFLFWCFLLGAGFFIAGCATTPKVDWNARVGNYTYDQAVAELGPPDKSAKLSDGKTIAEWITAHHRNSSVTVGTGFGVGFGGVGIGQTLGGGDREQILRLTFGPDSKLVAWKND